MDNREWASALTRMERYEGLRNLAALRYLIATRDRHRFSNRASKSAPPAQGPVQSLEEFAAEERAQRHGERAESDDPRIWWVMG